MGHFNCKITFCESYNIKTTFFILVGVAVILTFIECSSRGTLVSSIPKKKPGWVDLPQGINKYKGIATNMGSLEEARNGAVKDAMSRISEEIGVRVLASFEVEKSEDGGELDVRVDSKITTKAKAELKGLKVLGSYVEKHKVKDKESLYCYNGFALLRIPEGEVTKARRRIAEYNQKIFNEAEKLWDDAEKKENKYPYYALCNYRSIVDMLKNIDLPVAKRLLLQSENKKDYLEEIKDPMIELENLLGCKDIIRRVIMLDSYNSPIKDGIIDVGEGIRFELDLKDSSYIYVIGYDKETKEARFLFPNAFEEGNLTAGKKIYPEVSEFKAEPPCGSNTIFLIASLVRLNIPPFGRFGYSSLNNPMLWKLIKELKENKFDLSKVDFYIRRQEVE